MSRQQAGAEAPTMIIPRDTRIELDAHGQLSICAPGNLVLQDSGTYGTLESRGGSIRIEPGVEVEAVTVRCAEACYVQGGLTAWKVEARSLQIEETGKAYIVLQETESLDVGRQARLVGNFGSEKELLVLFSRFADQVRSLPFLPGRGGGPRPEGESEAGRGNAAARLLAAAGEPAAADGEDSPRPAELPDSLLFALVLLERELEAQTHGPTAQRVLEELVKLLRERDVETLRAVHKTLLARIKEPSDDVKRAAELLRESFPKTARKGRS